MNEKLNPVHPGEVLLEEFLKPMGLSQNKLSWRSVYIPGESMRSYSATDASLPILPCAWRATSAHRLSFGWDCRMIMIESWLVILWVTDWTSKCDPWWLLGSYLKGSR